MRWIVSAAWVVCAKTNTHRILIHAHELISSLLIRHAKRNKTHLMSSPSMQLVTVEAIECLDGVSTQITLEDSLCHHKNG